MITTADRSSRVGAVMALTLTLCLLTASPAVAQQTTEHSIEELARQVGQMNAMILDLRAEVARSRAEIVELRQRLEPVTEPASGTGILEPQVPAPLVQTANLPAEDRLSQLEESQHLLAQRLEEQYQTKVESSSRYRTKLSGIVLLNAFANQGRVENEEVPNLALRRGATDTARTFGLTALQSQVGFEAYGPTLAGAKVSAGLQFDFLGVSSSNTYGSTWGAVRLRTASVRLDWQRTSIVVGQDAPFFSALSPTSLASLSTPAFWYSGNLWTWIPQARVEHHVPVSKRNTVTFQGGFIDPLPRGSEQPRYAGRAEWAHGDSERPLAFGIGGYYGRDDRGAGRKVDSWAGTADWQVPLGTRLGISGEFYRGSAIGSYGAAQARNYVTSGPESDPASSIIPLNTIGGWAQVTFNATRTLELHAAHGEDQPFRRDLLRFSQNSTISRNRSDMVNLIYRPRTDLLFSLEYRRLKTWRTTSERNAAGHFNLGIGVLF